MSKLSMIKKAVQKAYDKKKSSKKSSEKTPDWAKGMSEKRLKELLGSPTSDSQGVVRHKKGGQIKTAMSDWMQGLTQGEIDQILGKPSRDSGGVKRSNKKTKTPKIKTAKSGGSIGCGKAVRGLGKGPYKKK
tara:strand:- start:1814 stop:2209 length:396 start_codon:yes stop_codon:yes gene_type:complete